MPSWLREVLEVLGFTTPFAYTAAVYALFHHLDKKAAGRAKKAISQWLQSKEYDTTLAADAMVELFDRLYTRPLFGWRAFRRSAFFTICMSVIFLFEFGLLSAELLKLLTAGEALTGLTWFLLTSTLLVNTVCDYAALFLIRRFLLLGRHKPILALLLGPVAGYLIVLAAFIILGIFLALLSPLVVSGEEPENIEEFGRVFGLNGLRPLMLAAFVVHLWLPLFAVCVVFLRALNYLRLAVGGVQWFVKKGREHPLDAIGYVAAGLVFLITVAIQRIL